MTEAAGIRYSPPAAFDWQLPDGARVTIRPIRADDAEREQAFVRSLSAESRYFRFLSALHELTPEMLRRFTRIDPACETALVATTADDAGERQVAVARYALDPPGERAEFAVVVADEWQGRGLGYRLMQALIEDARRRGLAALRGEVLSANHGMLELMQSLGFRIARNPAEPEITDVVLELRPAGSIDG